MQLSLMETHPEQKCTFQCLYYKHLLSLTDASSMNDGNMMSSLRKCLMNLSCYKHGSEERFNMEHKSIPHCG